MFQIVKKLIPVLTNFLSMTITSIKTIQKPSLGLAKKTVCILNPSLTKPPVGLKTSSKMALTFEYVLCIYYPICFHKDQDDIKALINLNSEVNIMYLAYTKKIRFLV